MSNYDKDIALIRQNTEFLKAEVLEIKESLKENYVTRAEYKPVQMIVFGMVGIMMAAILGAIIKLVIV